MMESEGKPAEIEQESEIAQDNASKENLEAVFDVLDSILNMDRSYEGEIKRKLEFGRIAPNVARGYISEEDATRQMKGLVEEAIADLDNRILSRAVLNDEQSIALSRYHEALRYVKYSLLEPQKLHPFPPTDIAEYIIYQNLDMLRELPAYLRRSGLYDDFYGYVSDWHQNQHKPEAAAKEEAADVEADKEVTIVENEEDREIVGASVDEPKQEKRLVEAEPLMDDLEHGLPFGSDKRAVRRIEFGEVAEPFHIGKIETNNRAIYDLVSVTGVWDIRPDGLVSRAESLYEEYEYLKLDEAGQRDDTEADISIPIICHEAEDFVDLPLPLGFDVIALDAEGTLEKSNLGTFRLSGLPTGSYTICFRIKPVDMEVSLQDEDEEKFCKHYQGQQVHPITSIADGLASRAESAKQKVEIIAGAIKSLKPIYSLIEPIGEIYSAASDDFFTATEAMQIGHCDSMSAHLVNRLRKNGIPALILTGLVVDRSKNAFAGNAGHSQVMYFDESANPYFIEATSMTEPGMAIDPADLPPHRVAKIVADIQTLPCRDRYLYLHDLAEEIRPTTVNHQLVADQQINIPESARPRPSAEYKVDYRSASFVEAAAFIDEFEREGDDLTLAKIRDLLTRYYKISWHSVEQYIEEGGVQLESLEERYRCLSSRNDKNDRYYKYHKKLITAAKDLLDLEQSGSDADQQRLGGERRDFQQWLFDCGSRRSYRDSDIENFHYILYLIGDEYLETVNDSQRVLRFCETAVCSIERYRSAELEPGSIKRLAKISSIARAKYHEDDDYQYRAFRRSREDTLEGFCTKYIDFYGQHSEPELQRQIAEIGLNIAEAGGEADDFLLSLVQASAAREYQDNTDKLMTLFKVLGSQKMIPDYLHEDGSPTEKLHKAQEVFVFSHWLPQYRRPFCPISDSECQKIKSFGFDLEEIFTEANIAEWIKSMGVADEDGPNYPWSDEGEPSEDYPLSGLAALHMDNRYNTDDRLIPFAVATTIRTVAKYSSRDIVRAAKDSWGEKDEERFFIALINEYGIECDYSKGQFVVKTKDPSLKLPVNLPESMGAQVDADNAVLARCASTPELSAPTRTLSAKTAKLWQKAYQLYPAIGEKVSQKILENENSQGIIVDQRRSEIVEGHFNPEERYEAAMMMACFAHEMQRCDASGIEDLAAKLTGFSDALMSIDQSVLSDQIALTAAVGRGEEEFWSQMGTRFNDLRLIMKRPEPIEKYRIYLMVVDMIRAGMEALSDRSYLYPNLVHNCNNCFGSSLETMSLAGENTTTSATPYAELVRSRLNKLDSRHLGVEKSDLAELLRDIRTRSSEPVSRGGLGTFAQFVSGLLGRAARINTSGGEFLQIREYLPGDDLRRIDYGATARTDKVHVKEVNEQKTNQIYLVADLEWFTERENQDELPPNLRYTFMMLFLAMNEKIPINLDLRYRGIEVLSKKYHELERELSSKDGGLDLMYEMLLMSKRALITQRNEEETGLKYGIRYINEVVFGHFFR